MVENTAVDPVAGNPNSLMAQMGKADFNFGTDFGGGNAKASSKPESDKNSIGVGLRFGRYAGDDYDQDTYTIPLSYTHRFSSNPNKQLLFDMPITYCNVEGSKGYSTSLGLGLRYPILENWTITPAVRAGAVGSVDMGSAAILYSASLVSNLNIYVGDFIFTLGNMATYFKSESIDADDYSVDYDLQNTMTKNGVGFEGPLGLALFDQETSWQFDVDTLLFWAINSI